MSKTLRDYITEAEAYVTGPVAGDEFDIEIAPGDIVSTYVLESTKDSVTVYGDERMMSLLETIGRYGAVGSNRGMGYSMAEASLSDLDVERQDWERMSPEEFQRAYGKSKSEWQAEYDRMFNQLQGQTRKAMQRTEKKDPDYCDACDRPNNRCVCESVEEARHFRTSYGWAGGYNEKTGKKYRHPEQTQADREARKQQKSQEKQSKIKESVNAKQIKKDLDAGMSYDAVIGKHANKRMANTDEIRRVIQQHAWEKRTKQPKEQGVAEGSNNIEAGDKISWYQNKFYPHRSGIVRKVVGNTVVVHTPESGEVYRLSKDNIRRHEKKADWQQHARNQGVAEDQFFQRVMELAGCGRRVEEEANTTDPLADKAAALAPVSAQGDEPVTTIDEGVMKSIAAELGEIANTEDYDALYDLMTSTSLAGQMVQKIADEIAINHRLYDDDHEELLELVMDRLIDDFGGDDLDEAEYQGRNVELNKPKRGGSKKFYVYVKDPKSGNVRKISFGDPNMKIKKSNPARRKSFRARHNCSTAKDKTSARYWSCKMW